MLKIIKDYNSFLFERLHIKKEIDEYSDEIYNDISKSEIKKVKLDNLPTSLNVFELNITIQDSLLFKSNGFLDLNKSHKSKNGWIIYLVLKRNFTISTLKHELNHVYRLTLMGKENVIKNLNHIKSKNIFLNIKNSELEYFFTLHHFTNDEELNSKIIETHSIIKDSMKHYGVSKLSNDQFRELIMNTEGYSISQMLINFKCLNIFTNLSENNINKMFYLLEENKTELDKIETSKFRNIKMFIKMIKDQYFNNTSFDFEDMNIYKPGKGVKFYDNWVNKQGEKLKRNLVSLYDHYKK